MIDLLVSLVIVLGAAFMLLGAVGMLRFPDVYTRLHALGLASGLGIVLVLTGTIIFFLPTAPAVVLKGLLTIVFIMLTFPVITHAIAWSAHHTGVQLVADREIDESRQAVMADD